MKEKEKKIKDDDDDISSNSICSKKDRKVVQEDCYLDEIDNIKSIIDNEESESLENNLSSGARMIPVEKVEVVFLSQVNNYIHRGAKFENY